MWTTAGAILEVSKSGSNTFYLTAITKKLRYLATICNQKSVFGTTGNLSADQVRLDYKYDRKHARFTVPDIGYGTYHVSSISDANFFLKRICKTNAAAAYILGQAIF